MTLSLQIVVLLAVLAFTDAAIQSANEQDKSSQADSILPSLLQASRLNMLRVQQQYPQQPQQFDYYDAAREEDRRQQQGQFKKVFVPQAIFIQPESQSTRFLAPNVQPQVFVVDGDTYDDNTPSQQQPSQIQPASEEMPWPAIVRPVEPELPLPVVEEPKQNQTEAFEATTSTVASPTETTSTEAAAAVEPEAAQTTVDEATTEKVENEQPTTEKVETEEKVENEETTTAVEKVEEQPTTTAEETTTGQAVVAETTATEKPETTATEKPETSTIVISEEPLPVSIAGRGPRFNRA